MSMPALALENFSDPGLTEQDLVPRLLWLRDVIGPRLERYLGYYRNHTTELAETLPCAASASFAVRPFRQYQELGLPARITGFRRAADGAAVATGAIDIQRKEVVIENDIAWRINTLVDFVAAAMPAITSLAAAPETRRRLTAIVQAIFDASGGALLLQQLVLHGALGGSAWVRICPTPELLRRLAGTGGTGGSGLQPSSFISRTFLLQDRGSGPGKTPSDPALVPTGTTDDSPGAAPFEASRWFRLEIVKASNLCSLPAGGDAANGSPAYAAWLRDDPPVQAHRPVLSPPGILERVRAWVGRNGAAGAGAAGLTFDLFGVDRWQRYAQGVLIDQGANGLGLVPFVRYENAVETAAGLRVGPAGSGAMDVGVSEVEPLIGLQDELNTRLSDRAYRVTMTSFRMWLGRGIEDFTRRPVGPGQMWATDNPAATIEAFGGDAATPSEAAHIEEVREALDKISGVPPVAAGVLRDKLGNLTSAVALRVTLIALLARTARKRAALTQTLTTLAQNLLELMDRAGIVASAPEDRTLDFNWPSALPESAMDQLQEAQAKVALGIPRAVVLGELGYSEVIEAASASSAEPPKQLAANASPETAAET